MKTLFGSLFSISQANSTIFLVINFLTLPPFPSSTMTHLLSTLITCGCGLLIPNLLTNLLPSSSCSASPSNSPSASLAVGAGRTILLERPKVIEAAEAAGIALVGVGDSGPEAALSLRAGTHGG